jgi:hypothetical protein
MNNNYLRFKDLSKKAQMKAESNYYAAKQIIKDYELHKTIVKVTAIFVQKGEEKVYEFSFNKSGKLLTEKLISRRFI